MGNMTINEMIETLSHLPKDVKDVKDAASLSIVSKNVLRFSVEIEYDGDLGALLGN